MEVSKIVERPGPSALARYIAVSASRISASAVIAALPPSSTACEMPIDAVIGISVSRTGKGRTKQRRMSSARLSASVLPPA
jgi:hypothetical protein